MAGAVELVGGPGFMCARSEAGAVSCWGRRLEARSIEMEPAVDLAVSGLEVCAALEGGRVRCFGGPYSADQTWRALGDTAPLGPRFDDWWEGSERAGLERVVALRGAADGAFCALHQDGRASCWGGTSLPGARLPEQVGTSRVFEAPSYPVGDFDDLLDLVLTPRGGCVARASGVVLCANPDVEEMPVVIVRPTVASSSPVGWAPLELPGDGPLTRFLQPGEYPDREAETCLADNQGVHCRTSGDRPPLQCGFVEDRFACWRNEANRRVSWLSPAPRELLFEHVEGLASMDDSGPLFCSRNDGEATRCAGPAFFFAGDPAPPAEPMRVRGVEGAVDLALGDGYACAADGEGVVRCWGGSRPVETEDFEPPPTEPTRLEGLGGPAEAVHAEGLPCVTLREGAVRCFVEAEGLLDQQDDVVGDGYTPPRWHVLPGVRRPSDVALGRDVLCAVVDRQVRCAGRPVLGGRTEARHAGFRPVGALSPADELILWNRNGCVRDRETVRCFGDSLPREYDDQVRPPYVVEALRGATAITRHGSGLGGGVVALIAGRIRYVGAPLPGLEPMGTTRFCEACRPLPYAEVAGVSDAEEIAVGEGFVCFRRATGRVGCIERPGGPLGLAPGVVEVDGPVDVRRVVASRSRACALDGDGAVWCWGAGVTPALIGAPEPPSYREMAPVEGTR